MKKYILSAILAGTTALAASSALALEPCKYSAGVGLGWTVGGKNTYTSNIQKDNTLPAVSTGSNYDMTAGKYSMQKGFPKADLRLGYNVNSFLQVGVNASWTNNLESENTMYTSYSAASGTVGSLKVLTKERIIDVLARAHFYSAESSTGTAMFMGPSLGYQNTATNLSLTYIPVAAGVPGTAVVLLDSKDLPKKNGFSVAFDAGIAQNIGRSGTSVELMATLKADMKREFTASDLGLTNATTAPIFNQKARPLGILSLAIKQSF